MPSYKTVKAPTTKTKHAAAPKKAAKKVVAKNTMKKTSKK